ncbi:MAG TPA: hypothetical protein VGO56_04330 [Pyrinomonadaceae bacterium]|jgi:hypothetical protein|nr:hypothetical protein [Pyrinomonadaceae bacterium]
MNSESDLPGLPAPFSPSEFLDRMKGDTPGLYLLGSLNRHITVHSQQCRAINLIQALNEHGGGLDGKALAIVGAGFAGLTAAAFALESTTAQVSLFDVSPRPLWLQDRCENRWLHPGIYDWPYPGALEPCTSLPVLNWRAAAAVNVTAQIRSEWERIAASKGLLRLRLETEVKAVSADPKGGLVLKLSDGPLENFDVVVLAVGFGLERGGPGRVAYWNDADGLDGIAEGSSVLVSGFGDGGLADVLRLCLPNIRQDSLIELVRHVPIETRRELIDADKNFDGESGKLDEFYRQLRIPEITARLDSSVAVPRVTLAGIGHLYDPRSAILNRFLISQLRQARGEDAFELITEPVDLSSVGELPDGSWRVKIGASATVRKFDHVVLRVGPEAVYQRISHSSDLKVWNERRKLWYDLPQSLDRTRTLSKTVSEPDKNLAAQRQDFIAYESSSRPWCLVLTTPKPLVGWAVHVEYALKNEARHVPNLNYVPLELCSEGSLTAEAIRGTVRALCAADIVVADVSNYDSIIFLLLGIRATVRRGVTIACTKKQLNDQLWEEIPFNLKELNLVSFFNEADGQKELRAALHAGLTQSGASAHYLDLPVYDFVREESSDEATSDPRRVLLLRAFRSYGGDRQLHVKERIREVLGFSDEVPVESLIDQVSPRLAGQRLYEAIRHWKTCLVDLTWWRPNVMFELGVRLSATSADTFCLIDPTAEGMEPLTGAHAELNDFLCPFQYNLKPPSFTKTFARENQRSNLVYEVAARHFRTYQDHYDEQVDDLLLAAAALTKGHDDPLQAVDISPLYARDNRSYGTEIRHSVFERLCAAWYYIADREEPFSLWPTDLLDKSRAAAFRRFRDLSARLKAGLALRSQPRDERLRRRIAATENQAKESGAMAFADLLDAWVDVRSDPPWQVKLEEVQGRDRSGFIQDWEDQLEKLTALEAMLVSLDSPVCELPLQGVRLDKRRVELVLQQFRKDNT